MFLTLAGILCLSLVSVQSAGQNQQAGPNTASVLQELSSVTSARSDLNVLLNRHKASVARLRRQEAEMKAACNCNYPSDYAFNAFLTKNVPNFGYLMEVPFPNVTMNHGNVYDERHSTFRAPVNGAFLFAITVGTAATHEIVVDVVKNSTPVMKIRTSSDYTWRMVTNTMIIDLQAGDDVWVRHGTISDSNYLYVGDGLYTSISGHLIARQ